MTASHYENFPVASWLCPPSLRPAVAAIYGYARTADDLADEGEASCEQRLADLRAYRADLQSAAAGGRASSRWPAVFDPLRVAIFRHALPVDLLADLLSAFEQDLVKHRYADRAELLDYCRRSANPIGRLLLHLYGIGLGHGAAGAEALRQSDSICSALQLVNFWQDLGVDTGRGRLYIPATDAAAHGVTPEQLLAREDSFATRALVGDMVRWARELMQSGAPLVHAVSGRAGWELRFVVQGGLRVLDRIEGLDFGTLRTRPVLPIHDAPRLLWRALSMRPPRAGLVSETA